MVKTICVRNIPTALPANLVYIPESLPPFTLRPTWIYARKPCVVGHPSHVIPGARRRGRHSPILNLRTVGGSPAALPTPRLHYVVLRYASCEQGRRREEPPILSISSTIAHKSAAYPPARHRVAGETVPAPHRPVSSPDPLLARNLPLATAAEQFQPPLSTVRVQPEHAERNDLPGAIHHPTSTKLTAFTASSRCLWSH